jgi:hypothetical protein
MFFKYKADLHRFGIHQSSQCTTIAPVGLHKLSILSSLRQGNVEWGSVVGFIFHLILYSWTFFPPATSKFKGIVHLSRQMNFCKYSRRKKTSSCQFVGRLKNSMLSHSTFPCHDESKLHLVTGDGSPLWWPSSQYACNVLVRNQLSNWPKVVPAGNGKIIEESPIRGKFWAAKNLENRKTSNVILD